MIVLSALAPTEVMAAEIGQRHGCRVEPQPPQRQKQVQSQQEQQQRARTQDCRQKRTIPPVVDPTPVFLL